MSLLRNKEIDVIIVEHKDRLTRFGFELVQTLLETNSKKILVIEEQEVTSDLVQDMIDVLTSFCARLYGARSAKNRAKKVIKDLELSKNEEIAEEIAKAEEASDA